MEYPAVNLDYLRSITDCTGVFQHSVHSVPNRRLGYTTDDNARALLVAAREYERTGERVDLDLATLYLSYLHYAQNHEHKYKNIMTFQRTFVDDDGTEDSFGRTMWALGYAASSSLPENVSVVARKMFDSSIVWAGDLISPRSRAYTIIGMYHYLRKNEDRYDMRGKIEALADSLVEDIKANAEDGWHWYEQHLTYGNAILPWAMLLAAHLTQKKAYMNAALQTTGFLTDVIVVDDRLEVVGNDGWYFHGRDRAWYDQQPIDAGYVVCFYADAYRILNDKDYLRLAHISHEWFFGRNRSGMPLYNPETQGCFDAMTPDGVNLNQGSESIICFLMAQQSMADIDKD